MLVVQQVGNAKVEPGVVRLEFRITLDPALEQLLEGYLDPDESEMEPVERGGNGGTGSGTSTPRPDTLVTA